MPFYRRSTQPRPPELPDDSINLKKRVIQVLLALFVFWIIYAVCRFTYHQFDYVPTPPPGILVSEDPLRQSDVISAPFQLNGYKVTPIAAYSIRARVVSVAYFPVDELSGISPADFILGWGSVSDSAVLDLLDIKQVERGLGWHYETSLPVSNSYITQHISLNHILPANKAIERIVMRVRKNNIIKLSGYLVNIQLPDGRQAGTRDADSERNTCLSAYFWVDKIAIEP